MLEIKKALLFQFSKLRVHSAPCVHTLADRCTDVSVADRTLAIDAVLRILVFCYIYSILGWGRPFGNPL